MSVGPAKAASLFDVFQELCLGTNADPSAVLAKADAMGWPKAPARLIRVLTKPSERGEVTTGAAGRGVQDLRGTLAVVVARTNWMIPRQEIPADTCSVVAGPSVDATAVAKDAEAFAALPGRLGLAFQKSAVGYLWREVDGRREPITSEQLIAAPRTGDVRMLVVMNLGQVSVIQLFIPAKEQI